MATEDLWVPARDPAPGMNGHNQRTGEADDRSRSWPTTEQVWSAGRSRPLERPNNQQEREPYRRGRRGDIANLLIGDDVAKGLGPTDEPGRLEQ